MNRRRVLAVAGAAGAVALAGCTGGGSDGGASTSDPSTTPTETGTATETATPTASGADPSIVDRSFARTGDASEPEESARVAFDADAVTVSGVISGKNGCMQASLGTAEYDPDGDELRVRVETVREGGDACTQQIVYRGYEATVTFGGGLPASVVVEHESMDEVRTITDVTR